MASIYTVMLYGAQSATESARILLENQPHIRRVDFASDQRTLRLVSTVPLNEMSLIPLLASSGISGFRLISCD